MTRYWLFHRDQFFALLPPPGKLTADIGCGEGRLPRDLKGLGHNVIGIDVSPTLIDAARKADPTGDYRCASATILPLPDKSCDLVIAFMSLHDIDDLATAVAEMGRVLVHAGIAAIAVVHPLNSAGRFTDQSAGSPFLIENTYLGEFVYASEESSNGIQMTFHSRHRPLEAYSLALEAASFDIEAVTRTSSACPGRWIRGVEAVAAHPAVSASARSQARVNASTSPSPWLSAVRPNTSSSARTEPCEMRLKSRVIACSRL